MTRPLLFRSKCGPSLDHAQDNIAGVSSAVPNSIQHKTHWRRLGPSGTKNPASILRHENASHVADGFIAETQQFARPQLQAEYRRLGRKRDGSLLIRIWILRPVQLWPRPRADDHRWRRGLGTRRKTGPLANRKCRRRFR